MGMFLTDPKCIEQRKIVGLPLWDKYDGEGITIFHNDVANEGHCKACKDLMQTILPKAKIYSGTFSYNSNATGITSFDVRCFETGERLPFEDFIVKYNISQINNSTGSDDHGDVMDSHMAIYMNKIIAKHNLFCTGAAGNFGGMTNNFQGAFVLVSGLTLMGDGTWRDYGSPGNPVDFSMFMGYQNGTSFSSPILNGMGGKLRSFYGRTITQAEIYTYFKTHCKDLGTIGKDPEYGWGLPVMTAPGVLIVPAKIEYLKNASLLLDGIVKKTSGFGNRYDPFTNNIMFHNGIDYAVPGAYSPPIHSPLDGIVVKKGIDSKGGLYIYIAYGGYVGLAYHCSKIIKNVGDQVKAGEIFAYVGSTGHSNGEHLHWAWIVNNSQALSYYSATYLDWEEEIVTEADVTRIVKNILLGANTEPSEWAKETWNEAVAKGITDGSNPGGYITREQSVVMDDRRERLNYEK